MLFGHLWPSRQKHHHRKCAIICLLAVIGMSYLQKLHSVLQTFIIRNTLYLHFVQLLLIRQYLLRAAAFQLCSLCNELPPKFTFRLYVFQCYLTASNCFVCAVLCVQGVHSQPEICALFCCHSSGGSKWTCSVSWNPYSNGRNDS